MNRESWLPATPASAGVARAIVREAAAEQGLGGDAVWDLTVATTEAVANAVQHGRACPESGKILLRVSHSEDGLHVEVCDCGRFDEPGTAAPADGLSGRGIPMMNALTDYFELVPEPSSTRVRFGKQQRAAAA
jgi:anti-sigma regulatory factor (Ser/Thr protein kinase)